MIEKRAQKGMYPRRREKLTKRKRKGIMSSFTICTPKQGE
jgi:hypothetical protein